MVKSLVLIIDDEPLDRQAVRRHLRQSEYDLLEARTAQEGFELLVRERVCCVILDNRMPGGDGSQVLLRLGAEHAVPVIMLTGDGSETLAVQAMKLGAEDYLPKEKLDRETLLHAIRNSIARAELRGKIAAQQAEIQSHVVALQRSNEQLELFAAMASHDLKSPLKSIQILCDKLQHQPPHTDDAARTLGQVQQIAQRMSGMLNTLLCVARLGSTPQPPGPVDLNRIMAHVVQDLHEQLVAANGQVTFGPLPTLTCDQTLLARLFANLVANGLKHNHNPRPTVHVSARRDVEHWVVSVKDNGIGIPSQAHETIFKAFVRLNEDGPVPGQGLGLTICRDIAGQLNGKIRLESQPGLGSEFFVVLPSVGASKNPIHGG